MSQFFQSLAYERPPAIGMAAPWFSAPTPRNPHFTFSSLGGRWILLHFFGDSRVPQSTKFLAALAEKPFDFGDDHFVSFGVTYRQRDLEDAAVQRAFPERRVFLDEDFEIARRYGLTKTVAEIEGGPYRARWFLLDPTLRVYDSGAPHEYDRLAKIIRELPSTDEHVGLAENRFAPVLVIPRVVSRDYCKQLIDVYNKGQPEVSGFMRQVDGKTVHQFDKSFKRRSDVRIADEKLRTELRAAVLTRIAPEIHKSYQFDVTRIERFIVACYDADEGGFFRAHRDNTTSGTAHRRMAVTINLNTEDYDGGGLRFPEYGTREFRAPTGGAVVFSCALLHEARPVLRGTRYATLPFLYDDAAAEIRAENRHLLQPSPEPNDLDMIK